MTGVDDLVFVAAAYLVILSGMAAYAVSLLRRLRRARAAAPPVEPSADCPG